MRSLFILLMAACLLVACGSSDNPGEPQANPGSNQANDVGSNADDNDADEDLDQLLSELRQRLEQRGIEPLEPVQISNQQQVELGHQLFFDPVLSGTKDVSCATCHPMEGATSDVQPLSAGPLATTDEYGDRMTGPALSFTPRTSPDLFNRGHPDFTTHFWDRRLEELDDGRFAVYDRSLSKVTADYLRVFDDEFDTLLGAQAMFPVTSRDEMRGISGDDDVFGEPNDLASFPDHDLEGIWRRLTDRILDSEEYRQLFAEAYPELNVDDITFVQVARALGSFMSDAFGVADSPWDQFLDGDDEALSDAQLRGADLFYGDAQCADCHSGALLTDQQAYNWGVPPMTRGPEPLDNMDLGVAHRSHFGRDAQFNFRTPPLRNVELTGPYMHNGVYSTLEAVIHHKTDPVAGLWNYNIAQLNPGFQSQLHTGVAELQRVEDAMDLDALPTPSLSDREVADLVAFMESLTSPDARDLTHLQLESVPSGLEVPEREIP